MELNEEEREKVSLLVNDLVTNRGMEVDEEAQYDYRNDFYFEEIIEKIEEYMIFIENNYDVKSGLQR